MVDERPRLPRRSRLKAEDPRLRRDPRISAIMPAFNAGATIESAVASVQAQTDDDWELIVVDDGSTDETLTLVQRMARADPRISVHAMPHRGRGAARNCAVLRACGHYLAPATRTT